MQRVLELASYGKIGPAIGGLPSTRAAGAAGAGAPGPAAMTARRPAPGAAPPNVFTQYLGLDIRIDVLI